LLADCCEIVIDNAWNKQHKTGIFINNVGFNYTFNGEKMFYYVLYTTIVYCGYVHMKQNKQLESSQF